MAGKQRMSSAVEATVNQIWGGIKRRATNRAIKRRMPRGRFVGEALEQRVLFTWIGATSGSANDNAHDYLNTANWSGGQITDNFSGVTFSANTTLYLSADRTTTSSGLNLNYSGNADLIFKSSSSTAHTLTLGGNITGDYGGSGNSRIVTLGDAANKLNLDLGGATCSLDVPAGDKLVLANVIANGSLNKSDSGTLLFCGADANTYTGITTVSGGVLQLGKTIADVSVRNLVIGDGANPAAVSFLNTSGYYNSTGQISNSATVTVNANASLVMADKPDTISSLIINGGSTSIGALVVNSSVQMAGGTLARGSSGALYLQGNLSSNASAATATISAPIVANNGSHTITVADGAADIDLAITGNISNNTSITAALVKAGPGTLLLSGSNTYYHSGNATTLSAGMMLVNNTTGSATGTYPVQVNSGATLGGSGTVSGAITVSSGGILAPGDASGTPGILSMGSLTLSSGSNFNAVINSSTAGSGYDQANVTGAVNLTGSYLNLSGTRTNHDGDVITLISNDGTDAVTGTFSGLAEGSFVVVNGVRYTISYVGGSGNDVTLTDSPSPHAADDNYNATENTTKTVAAAQGVLFNDTSPNGGTLSVYSVDGRTDAVAHTIDTGHGDLLLRTDGSLVYTPHNDFIGTDNATVYLATDGVEITNPATVQFVVGVAAMTGNGASISSKAGFPSGTLTLATFTDSVADRSASDYTASINWGDGTSVTGGAISSDGSGGWIVSGDHHYMTAGSYSTTITIGNSQGGSVIAHGTATVTTQAPAVYTVPGAAGTTSQVTLQMTSDPHDSLFDDELGLYIVKDGSFDLPSIDAGGDDAAYATAALSDASDQTLFTPIDPVGKTVIVDLPAGTRISYYMVQDGTTSDYLNGQRSATWEQNEIFPGHGGQMADTGPNVFFLNPSSNFDGIDHFDVTTNTDGSTTYGVEDYAYGGDRDYNDAVFTVSAVPSTVSVTPPSGPITGTSNVSVNLSTSFTDSNSGATHTASIDWGDGTMGIPDITGADITEPDGATAGSVSRRHTYTTPGTYTAKLTVQEVGSDASTEQDFTFTVSGGVITITPPSDPIAGATGSSTAISIPFTDTDPTAAHTATIDWGDGTTSTTGTITEPSDTAAGTVTGTHTYATAATYMATITVAASGETAAAQDATVAIADPVPAPTLATPAAATVAADGTSVDLSVLGADLVGESGLSYTWSTILAPAGAEPTFSANNDIDAKNSTATVSAVGDYLFEATITNAAGLSITSDVELMVDQVPTALSVSPATSTIAAGAGELFQATGTDQFGNAIDDPTVNWAVSGSDAGTINDAGFYTAPSDATGTFTITASNGAVSAIAAATVTLSTPDLTAAEGSDGTHIDVNWDFSDTPPNNAAGFDLERETAPSSYSVIADITDPTLTGYTDTDVSNGTTYTYVLKPYTMVSGAKVFGTPTAPTSVTMTGMVNASPTTDPILVNSGDVATITLPFTDSDASVTHTASIDWGDGTTDTPDVTTADVTEPSGSTAGSIGGTHAYADGTYTATVTINNSDGTSAPLAIEIEVGGIPDAPSGASASVSGGAVTVAWSAPSGGYPATGYTIYGSNDNGATWTALGSVDASQSTDSVSGLTASTSYIFQVTSTNDFGESAASTITTAITSPAVPAAPALDDPITLAAGNAVLNWSAGDTLATGYNIYVDNGDGSGFNYLDSVDAGTTTYTAGDLTPGTTYVFQVRAEDASGESAASNTASLTPPQPMASVTAAPTNPDDYTSITVTWTPDPNAHGYVIDRQADDESTPTRVETITDKNTGTWTDSAATDATPPDATKSYTYTVTAYYTATAPASGDPTGTGTGGTADTYTGNVNGFSASVSGNVAHLTWSYQDLDPAHPAAFELEMKDSDQVKTNFAYISSPSGRSADVTLAYGEHDQFRMRADHPDGTVSDYVDTSAYAPPQVSAPDPNPTLSSISATDVHGTTDIGTWNGSMNLRLPTNPSDPGGSDLYMINGSWKRTGDSLGLLHEAFPPGGELAIDTGNKGTTPASVGFSGTTGASYELLGNAIDVYTNQRSPTTTLLSVTLGGQVPPQLSLRAGPADASGNPRVAWDLPDGIDGTTGLVYFYRKGRQNGKDVAIPLNADDSGNAQSTPMIDGQATLLGLSAGDNTVFAVYNGGSSDGQISGWSPYSKDVTLSKQTAPAAPDVYAWIFDDAPPGQVEVHWVNTSSDETGYDVYRSICGGAFQKITHVGRDVTRLTDQLPSKMPVPTNGGYPIVYQVVAVNAAGRSAPGQTTMVIDSIPTAVDRAVVKRTVHSAYIIDDVIIDFVETLTDQFGNPMVGARVGEKVKVDASYLLRSSSSSIILGSGVTIPGGIFNDECGQVFYTVPSGAYIYLSQTITVGSREAIFKTHVDATGSDAGSTLRAIFH